MRWKNILLFTSSTGTFVSINLHFLNQFNFPQIIRWIPICTSKQKEEILSDSLPINTLTKLISALSKKRKIPAGSLLKNDKKHNFKLPKAAGKNKEHNYSQFSSRNSSVGHGDNDAPQGNQTAEPTAGYA